MDKAPSGRELDFAEQKTEGECETKMLKGIGSTRFTVRYLLHTKTELKKRSFSAPFYISLYIIYF